MCEVILGDTYILHRDTIFHTRKQKYKFKRDGKTSIIKANSSSNTKTLVAATTILREATEQAKGVAERTKRKKRSGKFKKSKHPRVQQETKDQPEDKFDQELKHQQKGGPLIREDPSPSSKNRGKWVFSYNKVNASFYLPTIDLKLKITKRGRQ